MSAGLLLLFFIWHSSYGNSPSLRSSDPFLMILEKQKSISVDLKKLFAENVQLEDGFQGSLYVGILHRDMKCVEIINENPIPYRREDGLYSRVPVRYDITEAQFSTLVQDNPLVVVKFNAGKSYMITKKINRFSICGSTVLLSTGKDEAVQIIARESLLKPDVLDIHSTNPRLRRFGLSSDSQVNDVPEGVQFIPPNPKRPLLGFGSDPSIQSLLLEPPVCNAENLRETLQTAFELEFFKLPLYATSLYTIKPTPENLRIRQIMYSVFLHQIVRFGQTANLLIAVGGYPIMTDPDTAPTFPSVGLPGNIVEGLYVPLSKLTMDQIIMFQKIHQRYNTSEVPVINDLFTIGAFYEEVLNCIEHIGAGLFGNPSGDQLVYDVYSAGSLYQVKGVSSAQDAIDLIFAGDGTSLFHEILEEENQNDNNEQNSDDEDDTSFDPNRVHNMIDNPSIRTIIPGTECYEAVLVFNEAYVLMVKKLDYAFKVVNSSTINDAVNQMKETGRLALELLNVPYDEGSQYMCGPVWNMEFQDTSAV